MNIGFLCFYQLRSFMTVLEGQFISIDFLSKDKICQIWVRKLKGKQKNKKTITCAVETYSLFSRLYTEHYYVVSFW